MKAKEQMNATHIIVKEFIFDVVLLNVPFPKFVVSSRQLPTVCQLLEPESENRQAVGN